MRQAGGPPTTGADLLSSASHGLLIALPSHQQVPEKTLDMQLQSPRVKTSVWEIALPACVCLLVGTWVALSGSQGVVNVLHGFVRTAPVLKLTR